MTRPKTTSKAEQNITTALIFDWRATSTIVALVQAASLTSTALGVLDRFPDLHMVSDRGLVGLGAADWATLRAAVLALHDAARVTSVVVLGEEPQLIACSATLADDHGPFLELPAPGDGSLFQKSMADYYPGPCIAFRPVHGSSKKGERQAEADMTAALVQGWRDSSKLAAKIWVEKVATPMTNFPHLHVVDQHPPFLGVGAATWSDLKEILLALHSTSLIGDIVVCGEEPEFSACTREIDALDSPFVANEPGADPQASFEAAMAQYYPGLAATFRTVEVSRSPVSASLPQIPSVQTHKLRVEDSQEDEVELTVKQCGSKDGVGEMEVEIDIRLQQMKLAMAALMKELKSVKDLLAAKEQALLQLNDLLGQQTEEITTLTTFKLRLESEMERLAQELRDCKASHEREIAEMKALLAAAEAAQGELELQLTTFRGTVAERERELQLAREALAAEVAARQGAEAQLLEARGQIGELEITIESWRTQQEQWLLERADLLKKVESLKEVNDLKERKIQSLTELLDQQLEAGSQWAKDRSELAESLTALRRELQSEFDSERMELQKQMLEYQSRINLLQRERDDAREEGARQLQQCEQQLAAANHRIAEMERSFEEERHEFREKLQTIQTRVTVTEHERQRIDLERTALIQQLRETEQRLQAANRRITELEKQIVALEAEIRRLAARLEAKIQFSQTTTVKQTYLVQSFEVAAMLDSMDGSPDGLYLGLPIEVEGEGLYKDLIAAGRKPKPGPLSQPRVSPRPTPPSAAHTPTTFKVNTVEMAAKLAKSDGNGAGTFNGLPIEVVGKGLYIDLVRSGQATPSTGAASSPPSTH